MSSSLQTKEIVFHYAAKAGNVEVVEEIIAGLNTGQIQIAVNKQSTTGWTPLMIASQNGHLDIVKVLILSFQVKLFSITILLVKGTVIVSIKILFENI